MAKQPAKKAVRSRTGSRTATVTGARRQSAKPQPPKRSAKRESSLEVLKKFRQIFRAAKLHMSATEKSVGATSAQLWAMSELEENPGLRVGDLAEAMALHQSTVSNLVDTLEDQGLVRRERKDKDQRVVRLYLTAVGLRVIRKAPAPARGVLPDALEHLPAAALGRLDSSLALLLQTMAVKAPTSAAFTHLQDI
jgi:DNA-binding MarR family transcriptional regulator